MGSTFFPVLVPAADTATLAAQASAALASALMLATHWQSDLDPAVYLVSEKLDGVRAFWDGQVLRFRSGRLIAAPAWFTAALPSTPLDGELWLGRGSFDRLSGIVRRSVPVDAEWRQLRYMIFDLSGAPGPFGERAARVSSLLGAAGVPWLQALEQGRVPDRAALQRQLQHVVSQGGEGLMLHRAAAAGRLRQLPLPRPHTSRPAAFCQFSAGAGGGVAQGRPFAAGDL